MIKSNNSFLFIVCTFAYCLFVNSQEKSIHDLDFLIGNWEVEERNIEKNWWEKSSRTASYILDSTYIRLETKAITSTGKQRTYQWFIHYNSEEGQFEMISIYSNWPKIEFDILFWNADGRTLIIKNKKDPSVYHERYGQIVFDESFNFYEWKGENRYGDENDPSIWKYIENGKKL